MMDQFEKDIKSGQVDAIVSAVEKDPQIINSVKSESGDSLLHKAIEHGESDLAIWLIKKGADTEAKNDHGQTPVFNAIRKHDHDVFMVLLGEGADLTITDHHGQSLLMQAGVYGAWDVAKTLIDEGLDPHVPFNDGSSILHLAAYHDNIDLCRSLITEHNINIDHLGQALGTPLHMALLGGAQKTAHYLIDAGASLTKELLFVTNHEAEFQDHEDFPVPEIESINALELAIQEGMPTVVRHMIREGIPVKNAESRKHLLAQAAKQKNPELLKILAPHFDDLSPALHEAVKNGDMVPLRNMLEMVKKSVDKNEYKETLYQCVKIASQHFSTISLPILIEEGAELYRADDPENPIAMTSDQNHMTMCDALVLADAIPVNKEKKAELCHTFLRNYAIRRNEMPDQIEFVSALHFACRQNRLDLVKTLLKDPIYNTDCKSNDTNATPLYWAIRHNNEEMVSLLVQHGADVEWAQNTIDVTSGEPEKFKDGLKTLDKVLDDLKPKENWSAGHIDHIQQEIKFANGKTLLRTFSTSKQSYHQVLYENKKGITSPYGMRHLYFRDALHTNYMKTYERLTRTKPISYGPESF